MKWLAVLITLAVIASCFYPWVVIPEKNIIIGGFHSGVNDFGKPGIVHVFLSVIILAFILIKKTWSLRLAFFLSAVNIAWAIRNYFLISACRVGTCPEKQPALFVLLTGSLLLTIFILFIRPDISKPPKVNPVD